jgi:hypothetical protein
MRFKNREDPLGMTRELRRMWEVDLYDGDRNEPDCPIRTETVVAFNAVEAIRKCHGFFVVTPPRALHFVTWPELKKPGEPVRKIESTAGPTDEVVEPTIAIPSNEI